jgi:hypothetical protein
MQCSQCGSPLEAAARFCPACGHPVTTGAGRESGSREKARGKPWKFGMVLFPLVLAAGIAMFYVYLTPSMHPVIRDQPVVAAAREYDSSSIAMTVVPFHEDGADLVIALSDVQRFRIVRFVVPTATTTRPVMAYIGTDGRLITAISVSEHCGSTEFVLRNNEIECARCPSRWDMMTMEAHACCAKYYPDPIPSRVQGNEVRIPRVYVEKWAGRL